MKMSFKGHRIILLLLGSILLLYPIECSSSFLVLDGSTNSKNTFDLRTADKTILDGYTDVAKYEDGFIAVGSNGQIDRISKTGEINKYHSTVGAKFKCVLTHDKQIIAAGDNGDMLISYGSEKFEKINSGTDGNINSLTWFDNKVIAGADGGEILIGNNIGEFKSIQLNLKGDVVSVSANAVFCFGVTNAGEIIHTTDGENWNVFDFNQEYKGFYKTCYFTSVLVTERNIAVTGIKDDGLPVFMLSNKGKVWSERDLSYKDEQGIKDYLKDLPNDIFYDGLYQQYYLACENGKLLVLPTCSHCNELAEFPEVNLAGISGINEMLMIVGEGFFVKPISF
ncbi:MAG: hypothetical protein WC384_09830 [Prolixibacteraceae bacterium]